MNYPAIIRACFALAEQTLSARYKRDLLHIGKDAQAADDGCPASAESVAEFLAGDHELEMLAAKSFVPARRNAA